ncbi:MAG: crotonase/enoyl-CoA hydratase family protein [Acidimicrobiales bacterium]|nr:crotonase/enoyl-CoA hydratase family protein [Acidimicrobiales bacterium]MDG2219071.1 crotonase/enoyl-CoA hydratase family protein [Acidimicrobiales bacterium]
MSDDDVILYEKRDRLAILTLNRPGARNAVNGDVAQRMEALLDDYEADDELWAAILTGNGPTFCAGADLKEIAAGNGASLTTERGGFGGLVMRDRRKPLVAAITGSALAGGTELALACDLIVCANDTRFGLPEVKRSLVAAAGALFRLPRAIGMAPALEAIMTGEPLPAQRAYDLGMVNRVVPAEQVMNEAVALAELITANAPLAVEASRTVAIRAYEGDDDELMRASLRAIGDLSATEDFAEGPRAFIEKRLPVWKGR